MSKYAVHKLWFFYTDEWYVTSNELAHCIGIYDTYEEALNAKANADRKSLLTMNSYDLSSDLMGFSENAYGNDFTNSLIEYYKSQNWHDSIKEVFYDGKFNHYEVLPPKNATDDQLDEILRIAKAYFHRIIEYKDIKESIYVKLNYDFWGKKVFDKLKTDGVIESRSTPEKGFYLVNKPPKGRKSAKFTDFQTARDLAIQYTNSSIIEFEDNNFLGRTYFEDTTVSLPMLIAYVNNCNSITLQEEEVSDKNVKIINSKLKKLKSNIHKAVGDKYYTLKLPNNENLDKDELNGVFELLKQKPFKIYRVTTEINGEEVKGYVSDSSPL